MTHRHEWEDLEEPHADGWMTRCVECGAEGCEWPNQPAELAELLTERLPG